MRRTGAAQINCQFSRSGLVLNARNSSTVIAPAIGTGIAAKVMFDFYRPMYHGDHAHSRHARERDAGRSPAGSSVRASLRRAPHADINPKTRYQERRMGWGQRVN